MVLPKGSGDKDSDAEYDLNHEELDDSSRFRGHQWSAVRMTRGPSSRADTTELLRRSFVKPSITSFDKYVVLPITPEAPGTFVSSQGDDVWGVDF